MQAYRKRYDKHIRYFTSGLPEYPCCTGMPSMYVMESFISGKEGGLLPRNWYVVFITFFFWGGGGEGG